MDDETNGEEIVQPSPGDAAHTPDKMFDANATEELCMTFKKVLESGKRSIPSVVLPLATKNLAKRHGFAHLWLVLLIIISSWPFLLNLGLRAVRPGLVISQHHADLWLASFGLIDALMLYAALTAWEYITSYGEAIDQILHTSPDKDKPALWLQTWLKPSRQMVLPYFGLISSPLVLAIIHNAVSNKLAIGLASCLMAAWTGFIGGSVLYWLWVVPGTPRQLQRAGNLSLTWIDPSSTPALRGIARALGIASLFILAGVLSISILGLALPDLINDRSTKVIAITFFIVSAATTVRVAIYPIPWYYRIINKEKTNIQRHLLGEMPSLEDFHQADDQTIARYREISATKDLPFSTVTIVQYSAAMIGAIAALIFNALYHH